MHKSLAMALAFTLLASTTGLAMAQANVNTNAGVTVDTTAGSAGVDASGNANASGANANAGGKAAANVSGSNSDNTYGAVISSIKSSSTVDLSGINDASKVLIVLVSSLPGNAATKASALDNALTENAAGLSTLHSSIKANASIKAKLEADGYSVDDVVAVSSGVDGSVTVYVDDRA